MFLVSRKHNLCHGSWQILRLEPLLLFIYFSFIGTKRWEPRKGSLWSRSLRISLDQRLYFLSVDDKKESLWDQGMVPPQSQQIEFHLIIHKPTIRYVAMIVQLGLCFGYVSKFSPYTSCIWFFFNFFQASAFKISLRKLNSFIKIW